MASTIDRDVLDSYAMIATDEILDYVVGCLRRLPSENKNAEQMKADAIFEVKSLIKGIR